MTTESLAGAESRPLLLTNIRALVTCDDLNQVSEGVDLLCEDGVITAIGRQLEAPPSARVINASDLLVYPGLVNTHHHFFQAFVRNQIGLDWASIDLVTWLDRIYPIFARTDEDCIYHTSMVAMAELIKHGCTTAFDHQYCYTTHAGKHLIDRQFEAAERTGIRYVAGRGVNTMPASEGSTVPDAMVETTDEYLADSERLIKTFHDPDPFAMRSIVLAPCQPINCHRETFTESIILAREHGVSLHTHLSEGENALMQSRHGMRCQDWVEDVGFVGPDVWYAHCWETTPEEFRRMAALETGFTHCPGPMCLVGDGVTNIAAAYKAGVRMGMGVDGYASNDNSSLMECMHLAYLVQCLQSPQREDPMPPTAEFLRMATVGGASVLNRPELGTLEVGQAADFFALDARAIEFVGATHDPLHMPVKVGIGRPVDLTVINGKVVWQNGEFSGFDESEAAFEAEAVFRRVIYDCPEMRAVRGG